MQRRGGGRQARSEPCDRGWLQARTGLVAAARPPCLVCWVMARGRGVVINDKRARGPSALDHTPGARLGPGRSLRAVFLKRNSRPARRPRATRCAPPPRRGAPASPLHDRAAAAARRRRRVARQVLQHFLQRPYYLDELGPRLIVGRPAALHQAPQLVRHLARETGGWPGWDRGCRSWGGGGARTSAGGDGERRRAGGRRSPRAPLAGPRAAARRSA